MTTTCVRTSGAGVLPVFHCNISPSTFRATLKPTQRVSAVTPLSAVLTDQPSTTAEAERTSPAPPTQHFQVKSELAARSRLNDYLEQSRDLMVRSDGGPPRWFSPLECGSRLINNSPLLLFLPGIGGVGLGLMLHHQRLGEIFDIWCLHIPLADRTPFAELVKLVETTVRSEYHHSPKRPIYLVGESVGGCLALAVAAHNPDIDLMLILSNPATCFNKSQLPPLKTILQFLPDQLPLGLPSLLALLTGVPSRTVISTVAKGLPLQQTTAELSEAITALVSYLSGLADALTVETLLWKLKMLDSACAYANSRLHAVLAKTLVLSSGTDQFLPSLEEGQRLRNVLPNCDLRTFEESGHAFFLEDGHDLVTIIKGAGFYRRSKIFDYASDYFPPSPLEIENAVNSEVQRFWDAITSPVMLSTLENGKIVRGLSGIPSDGPVLIVGYHNMLGFELGPVVRRIFLERNILVRGVAHPMMFTKMNHPHMPDVSSYDVMRIMGAVPVSATNFYKLFSLKSHVLLYPGGMREALHRKGEEYKLFWPEHSEFIRMAARFGAKIIPFGAVGEDDIAQLLFDYNDQMNIPFMKAYLEHANKVIEPVKLRTGFEGEVGKQDVHLPVLLPKLPGRYYYLFGKPIETEGRKQELRSREKAHELYLEVKSGVEKCLAYLKEKRESDPYRSIIPRTIYQATHGPELEVPTFEI